MLRQSSPLTSADKFRNCFSYYLQSVQRNWTTCWLMYLSHCGTSPSVWFSCVFIPELKAVGLCLSAWVQPLAQWGSRLGLVLLDVTVMQINNCQWNPGLVPLDTYIILGVLICLLTLSASLRLGRMPCSGGNVHTVKAAMPDHFPKRLPLWVVKCIFVFYFHSIIFSISRERFFFFYFPLSSTI